jgi:hypothetical protein
MPKFNIGDRVQVPLNAQVVPPDIVGLKGVITDYHQVGRGTQPASTRPRSTPFDEFMYDVLFDGKEETESVPEDSLEPE